MNQILTISGYKFITQSDLSDLQSWLLGKAREHALKGTILISPEGVNINLSGIPNAIMEFISILRSENRFQDMTFRESYSSFQPFKQLKVKIKKEIITLKKEGICPQLNRAASIKPKELKRWYDEQKDFVMLDTRNEYEFRFGSFQNAINLHLSDFSEFPDVINHIESNKPIVMFCTGGIRCEKAALVMLDKGFSEVYQLEGGILNYFKEVGTDYFNGECFVFDQRIALNSRLETSGTKQCRVCQNPVWDVEQVSSDYIPNVSCPSCVNHLT